LRSTDCPEEADSVDARTCPLMTGDIDGLRYSPDDPQYSLGPGHTCLYVWVHETGDWDCRKCSVLYTSLAGHSHLWALQGRNRARRWASKDKRASAARPLFTQNKHYENSLGNPTYAGCKLSFTPGLSSLLLATSVRFPFFFWIRHHHMAWCWFVTRSHDVQVIPPWQSFVTGTSSACHAPDPLERARA